MTRRTMTWLTIPLILLLLASLACNLGTQAAPTATPSPPPSSTPEPPTPTPPPTETPVPGPTPEPQPTVNPLLVTALDQVRLATIQIEAEGTFVDPLVGLQTNVAGAGSGFIIDESGIAVTNNHVVTGAALLRVWIGGQGQPLNARVLGVSECSDLAVIDIEGDGYHYLEWYDEPIRVGLDVYAGGYPLADPEFTLTRGIVSKEKADGDTDWASVNYVIQHDAVINPGNSGGPLVTSDAKVVGVNYASWPEYEQYFAVARDEALQVIDELRAGHDVTSIGVNGSAVSDDQGTTGIWVASVDSGSPAETAGVRGGDIITLIEGVTMAADGTMAQYCDVLASHGPDDTLALQVLRYDTQEVLEGQLNGRPLELAFSFAQQLEDQVGGAQTGATYAEFVSVTDDTDAITMDVPVEWSEVDGTLWQDEEGVVGASIAASTDLEAFYANYDTPGVVFVASSSFPEMGDADALLDLYNFHEDCTYDGRYDYEDALYVGAYDLYYDCDGADMALLVVAALPEDQSFATLVLVQAVGDEDLDAMDRILDTFVVIGPLPSGETGGGGAAGGASLTVTNQTGGDIWYLYISPAGDDSWGDDWLGGDVLLAGDSYTVLLDEGEYDLAAADPGGDIVVTQFGVLVSGDQELTLTGEGGAGAEGSVELRLVNQSGWDVCYVYISLSTSDQWGDDWLATDQTIADGESFTFLVPLAEETYDLQALDCGGEVLAEEYEVALEKNKIWTISPP